jgi:hypothetical protein
VQGGADAPKPAKKDDLPWPLIAAGGGLIAFIIWRRRQNQI